METEVKLEKFKDSIQKEKVEEAKRILKEQEEIEINKAIEEYNSFVKEWENKHQCSILICGAFEGNKIETALKIVKIK